MSKKPVRSPIRLWYEPDREKVFAAKVNLEKYSKPTMSRNYRFDVTQDFLHCVYHWFYPDVENGEKMTQIKVYKDGKPLLITVNVIDELDYTIEKPKE